MATINGNNRNNFLRGTNSADTISGRGGNDVINGRAGSDRISGGSGNDSIDGGRGNDSIDGGRGNDSIDGGRGLDLIDFSDATGGINFTLVQSSSWTTVNLSGVGLGTDTYKNIEGVIGTNFNDRITGSSLDDKIYAGGGNDTVNGLGGNDWIDAGSGNDSVDGGDGNDTIYGGSGNDSLLGGMGKDWIDAGSGNDTVDGGAGNDTIYGGSGNDTIYGGDGNDWIDAGSGDDSVVMLVTTGNVDTIDAGTGIDTLVLTGTVGGTGVVIVDLSSTTDQVVSIGGVADALVQKNFENLDASGLGSSIYATGSSGADVMTGSAGNDTLSGGAGNDTIFGGAGNDLLTGGSGADQLTGGSGQDRFIYQLATDSPAAGPLDSILDFTLGQDKIDLAAFRGADDLIWRGEDPAVPGPWGVRYHNDTTSTFVYADTSGDGIADLKIELRNTPGLNLESSDFIGVAGAQGNAAPTITSGTTGTEAENTVNTNVVYTATATDLDAGDSIAWSLTGADASLFTIDSDDGEVRFNASPNYEAPADAGFNNVYDIVVHASDGTLEDTQAVAITVTDANDVAPTIISGASGSEAENTATSNVVYDANATDPDTVGTVAFSLTGTDATLFSIDSDDGEVRFLASPNYEAPADTGGNNVYDVVVHAKDGVHDTTKAVAITVTDVNDVAPAITTAGAQSVDENAVFSVALSSTDVDTVGINPALFTITGGADQGLFAIDGSGNLTMAAQNFEVPSDADTDNTYVVQVTANDGAHTTDKTITVTVTDVNDAPVTTAVTLAAMAEDSGAQLITQAELLANASDVDNTVLTATGLAISSGNGTLVDNLDGTWSYTPVLNDDTAVSFSYSVSDGAQSAPGSATLDITPVNDAPVTTAVTLAAMAEDSGAQLITQAELLANASDVDNTVLTATGLAISSGNGTLVDNLDGTWSYTPVLNDDTAVSFSYSVSDGAQSAPGSATLDITPVNDAPVTTAVTLAAMAEDSGAQLITQAELLANASDVDNTVLTATGLAISSGNGTLVDNLDGTWSYTPVLNDDTAVSFSYSVSDGAQSAPGSATLDITPVNDAPVTTAVTLAAMAEDSGAQLITQAELLANASDVDNTVLTATGLAISSGNGTLVDNLDGTWSYTPVLNDDTAVSFSYSVSDGAQSAPGSATLDITPVNDAPVTTAVTLAAMAEDSGAQLITQAELLANASDVDNTVLTATGLAISSGNGTLVDNLDGTWSYTPVLNDDTAVSFSYSVSDGAQSAPGSATLDITPVNDAPVTTAVTLAAMAEDSGAQLITQAELLANASDVDNTVLTATGLAISSGNGTLVDNLDGTWSYTPVLNDDTAVSFSYSVSDGAQSAPGSATLDITPVNDAPVTTAVTLAAMAEDSGAQLITQAELLANASDVDNTVLTATGLAISSGNGTLVDNLDGTWSYTPVLNDDTAVSFSYSVSDGAQSAPGSATLDITPVNDAPVTTAVTLAAMAEDSGAQLITQAELLANASDVDNTVLTATGLAISSGNGTLVDNLDGTWSYTPVLNDDTAVSFSYSVSDGAQSAPGSATLDITPVNDAPVTTAVTLAAMAEDSGAQLITQAELLANASDVDNTVLTATGLAISSGNGTLVDNLDGTWSYTPVLNDDTAVSFSYSVSDGAQSAPGSATLDITPVNDAPVTTAVTLAAMAEDSGAQLITQAELLANASDVDNTVLTATGLAISSGNGTLVDNLDGTWSYTPVLNDDTAVSFSYSVSDGAQSAPGSATLDITPVNDAPVTTAVTLAAMAEDSGAQLITQAELLANASDVDNTVLTATGLAISSGNGTLVDNLDGTWSYTPVLNDDTAVSFSYSVSDGAQSAPGSATLDITPVNDAPVTTAVTLAAMAEDSGAQLITQAELLANASDVDNTVLTATGLAISSGNGTLVDNLDGTWSYTPVLNDDTAVSFSYSVSDGAQSAPGSATLDITPVNDAPVTTAVTLAAMAEDSGAQLITQAELLANASDVDNTVLTATGLAISSGNGTLVDNLDGTWSYTPVLNDDTAVSFSYSVSDGAQSAPGSATLDITPVNDAPVTTAVTLAAMAEDSGAQLITQAELLANASDVDNTVLTATGLAISSGNGTLVDNLDGTWSYTPVLNDDTAVSFSYSVSDGAQSAPGSATLDITPVNDAATITGETSGEVIEAGGVANAIPGTPTATRDLSATDVDNANDSFQAVAAGAVSVNGYGTYEVTAAGVWTYTLDNTNVAVQRPNNGNSLSDTFTVHSEDGTAKMVTITINGADDFLFDENVNTVNFNDVVEGTYVTGTQYDALGGNDFVTLPNDLTQAEDAGFDSKQTFHGGAGNDTITAAGNLNSSIDGGTGNDTVNGGAGNDTIVMLVTAGDVDEAHGGSNTPIIVNGTLVPGRDTLVLSGEVPDDGIVEIRLSADDQVVKIGGTLDNTLTQDGFENLDASLLEGFVDATGSDVANTMVGTNHADLLVGGGDDTLHGGGGDDLLLGDDGDDTLFGDADSDVVIGGMGNDTLDGGDGDDSLFGDDGDDNPIGGNDILIGGPGDDYLDGGAGADTMYGGEDNNTLIGGPGDDYLVGGAGSDTFVYIALSDADAGTAGDTINNFTKTGPNADKLNLYDLLTSIGAPHNSTDPALSDFLRLNTTDSTGNTLVEVDGDGGGNSWVTLATVAGVSLTLDDIIL